MMGFKGKNMTPEQDFILKVQLLAQKYGVTVDIDFKNKTVNFLTDDQSLQMNLAWELDRLFSQYSF